MSEPFALDTRPLEKAIGALKAALDRHAQSPGDDIVRDACIQRFEFTYELSHKMLKRFLEATSANPAEFDAMPFQDLIRTGSERGLLLSDWSRWKVFRTARSITSHTYDEAKAREVFAIIPEFLAEASHLRDRLKDAAA
jgi:nucleotidyltransferase substrate binding protein (TIGR01987 family)